LADVVRINENDPGSKTISYFQKTKDGKQILREVMNKYIPDDIANAEKQGFSAPDASWFKGESIDYVRSMLYNGNAQIYSFLDRGSVQAMVAEHLDGKENRRLFIWSLLNFEQWCKQNIA
jgi:asparagine synthase (glutamine-hydrolysing)